MKGPDSAAWRKMGAAIAVLVVIFIVFPTSFRLIFAADRELSYSAGISSTTCEGLSSSRYSSPESCRVVYRLLLGNTGTELLQDIQIRLEPVPDDSRLNIYSQDIVASARQSGDLNASHEIINNALGINLGQLAPNRQVYLDLVSAGVESLELLQDSELSIEADAVLIDSNPQLTVISRFFRNLVSVFGL
jgi:hypothetical protein